MMPISNIHAIFQHSYHCLFKQKNNHNTIKTFFICSLHSWLHCFKIPIFQNLTKIMRFIDKNVIVIRKRKEKSYEFVASFDFLPTKRKCDLNVISKTARAFFIRAFKFLLYLIHSNIINSSGNNRLYCKKILIGHFINFFFFLFHSQKR